MRDELHEFSRRETSLVWRLEWRSEWFAARRLIRRCFSLLADTLKRCAKVQCEEIACRFATMCPCHAKIEPGQSEVMNSTTASRLTIVSVYRAAGASFVAQIFNLPYRRLAVGRASDRSHASAVVNGWQSATVRYSAARRSRSPIVIVLLLVLVLDRPISDDENEDDDEDERSARPAAIRTDIDRS